MNRGLGAIERSAANRGNLFSGRTGTALSEFAQGIGEQSLRDRLDTSFIAWISGH